MGWSEWTAHCAPLPSRGGNCVLGAEGGTQSALDKHFLLGTCWVRLCSTLSLESCLEMVI